MPCTRRTRAIEPIREQQACRFCRLCGLPSLPCGSAQVAQSFQKAIRFLGARASTVVSREVAMTRRSEPMVLIIASLNLFLVAFASADDKQPAKTGQSGNSISGCMTTACHGANSASDAPLWQRAGSIWFDQDPHAQAYTS